MADLDITALDTWMLREPVSRRGYCVLRLWAKSGLAGFGECGEVSAAEIETARRAVTGRLATSFEDVRIRLASTPRAQAGINMAMLDLVGKFTKAPVYQVLGGPTRHRLRALASLDGAADEDRVASLKARHTAGFRAFAVPLPRFTARNQGQAFAEAVSRRFDKLRTAAGDADFVLDGAASLTTGDAGRLAAAIEHVHLLWFDEPCPLSNLSAVRKITGESATPL